MPQSTRSLITKQSSTIFTCGEDGKVRSWRAEGFGGGEIQQQGGKEAQVQAEPAGEKKSSKEKKHKDKHKKKDKEKGKERFKPY